jgi:hypothetical protein
MDSNYQQNAAFGIGKKAQIQNQKSSIKCKQTLSFQLLPVT